MEHICILLLASTTTGKDFHETQIELSKCTHSGDHDAADSLVFSLGNYLYLDLP